ncbi:MAG: hypothetical protein F7C82_00295 [Desulfurococcales archaeon]|nr:hypothetical protein [Desulfurococcales archaeon]MCE4623035.1 hypothetical protein [Desulfurococcales archaeon]MCE4626225.1 hypothetical protein [Desulfurococcales archaeon]MCE4628701.1 hypothetical protein [Desulfurococcales archaeon]
MGKRLYECIVCGRKFPEGQGIIISKGGVILYFHSNRCASKFFKRLIENTEDSCIVKALKETQEEFKQAIDAKKKSVRKVI